MKRAVVPTVLEPQGKGLDWDKVRERYEARLAADIEAGAQTRDVAERLAELAHRAAVEVARETGAELPVREGVKPKKQRKQAGEPRPKPKRGVGRKHDHKAIAQRYAEGVRVADIAVEFKCDVKTVYNAIHGNGIKLEAREPKAKPRIDVCKRQHNMAETRVWSGDGKKSWCGRCVSERQQEKRRAA